MTRFQQELNGLLGVYWIKNANKTIAQVKSDFIKGAITIDENGVARNCIGRALMSDMMEVLETAGCLTSYEKLATIAAREDEVGKTISRMKIQKESEEEIYEMQTAFGKGTTVVDIITGKKIRL